MIEIPRYPIRFGDIVKVMVLETTGPYAEGEVLQKHWGLSIRNH